MKIGVHTSHIDRWGTKRYEKLKKFGFSCVDMQMANTDAIPYTLPHREQDLWAEKEKQLAHAAGIEIFQAHGPWRYPPRDGTCEDRVERMEKMKTSIRLTAMLDCKNWVIHPIMPFELDDIAEGNAQKTWDMNLTFMSEILKTAKEYGVTICMENMPFRGLSLAHPKEILRFVQQISDPNFKICLDTGHTAVFPDITPGEAVRMLANEIRVLHIHDNDGRNDWHWVPYKGIVDWKDFGKALQEIGFTGAFSYEASPTEESSYQEAEEAYCTLVKLAEDITAKG